jgi:Tfp pilus assembly protein PilV
MQPVQPHHVRKLQERPLALGQASPKRQAWRWGLLKNLAMRGITLLESLLAAVVLAMAIGAIIIPFAAGAQATMQEARQTLAVNLAQDLMEEILTRAFKDPDGSESGETGRSNWEDMADYNGYTENPGNIVSFDGTVVTDPAATGLSRQATVADVYVSGQDTGKPPTFCRITVEIKHHGQPVVKLSRLVYGNE